MKKLLALVLVAMMCMAITLSTASAAEVWTHVKPAAVGTLDDIIYAVGWTMGYWEEEGIDMRVEVSIGSETKMVAAGKADSCGASPYILLNAIENGIPLLSFYQVDSINFFCFAFNPEKGFKTMADLKGKTIALGNISWKNIAAANLMAGGVDPSEVNFVVTADSRSQLAWDQKVDAVLTWEKEYQQWEAAGMHFNYIYGWDYLKGPANSLSTTHANLNNEQWVAKAKKAAAGYAKSMYFIHCNPAAATEIGLKYFPALTVPYDIAITAVVAATQVHSGSGHALNPETGYGYHDPTLWDTMQDYCLKAGVITAKLAPEDVYTNQFAQGVTFDRAKIEQQAKDYVLTAEHQVVWDTYVQSAIDSGVDKPWLTYQKQLRGK